MVKFGILLPQGRKNEFRSTSEYTRIYDVVEKVALESERLGFDSVWLNDHFFYFQDVPFLECWTTLSALAFKTKKIKLGSLVLCNSYRHPSMVSKMASTLDVISKGRLMLGLGAGWHKDEYKRFGFPFQKLSKRVEQLRESVFIIKQLWQKERLTFNGKYYNLDNCFCNPKPFQKPFPPVWIGGKEEKYLLKVVAELADGCNFGWSLTPEEYRNKIRLLKKYCSMLGRRHDEIRRSIGAICITAERNRDLEIEKFKPPNQSMKTYSKSHIVGTADQCIEKIRSYMNAGVDYFILYFPNIREMEYLRYFGRNVIAFFEEFD